MSHYTCPSCGSVSEEDIRRLLREELDRRPEGWDAYSRACVEWFEYQRKTGAHWDPSESVRLEQAARELRPKEGV